MKTWWTNLKEYTEAETNYTSWKQYANPTDFPKVLSSFLFSPQGSPFQHNFKFKADLQCDVPAPEIVASKFEINYLKMNGPEEHIPAQSSVKAVINSAESPYTFSHSKIYAAWETDEIIGKELYRNLGLAMACIFCVTLLLLCNVQICIMVILIVLCTLTDIIGFLHFWGITIDIISCIAIVLSAGLCVDYSVHIGHAFLVAKGNEDNTNSSDVINLITLGNRQGKCVEAAVAIGPAVANGGMTTFLALLLCYFSTGHVFITFFKVSIFVEDFLSLTVHRCFL